VVHRKDNTDFYYILLGSNIGAKELAITDAVTAIGEEIGRVLKQSDNYYSAPWGFDSENEFVNAVIEVQSNLEPLELLGKLLEIEQKLGRIRNPKQTSYADRIIDLDILLYGDTLVKTAALEIPHPRMHLRAFTLIPLIQVLPHGVHPILNYTYKELLDKQGA